MILILSHQEFKAIEFKMPPSESSFGLCLRERNVGGAVIFFADSSDFCNFLKWKHYLRLTIEPSKPVSSEW